MVLLAAVQRFPSAPPPRTAVAEARLKLGLPLDIQVLHAGNVHPFTSKARGAVTCRGGGGGQGQRRRREALPPQHRPRPLPYSCASALQAERFKALGYWRPDEYRYVPPKQFTSIKASAHLRAMAEYVGEGALVGLLGVVLVASLLLNLRRSKREA